MTDENTTELPAAELPADDSPTPTDELPAVDGGYAAICELCGWTLTGERSAVIRAAQTHECHPDPTAGDSQPSVDSPASPDGAAK